ncbi:MAG TPA: DUF3006 domain-containing protein [Armatimonadota bacterium]|jgi:hypothetical protein
MRAFIDRIASDTATLLLGEDEHYVVHLPIAVLPPDVHEGTVLEMDFRIDAAATEAGKADVQRALDDLQRGTP